jgi:hypothetical protein
LVSSTIASARPASSQSEVPVKPVCPKLPGASSSPDEVGPPAASAGSPPVASQRARRPSGSWSNATQPSPRPALSAAVASRVAAASVAAPKSRRPS